MSTFSLTKGSAAALGMLASQAGSDTLLLTQPARELRAELSIEPFTGDSGDQLRAVLFMREQRHSMTLQRDDSANVQHLADWIEAVANGTLDTAQAIPQRQPVLLPCCRCEGEAIAYSYLAPAPAQHDRHGVKCRHRDCQSLERAASAAAAADAWNDIQREELAEIAEPAPAQDDVQREMERHRKTWRQLEQVRGLLRLATDRWESWASEIIHTTPEYESELSEIARVRAALSQQAEVAEPAPAQDEREAFEAFQSQRPSHWRVTNRAAWEAALKYAAENYRPAQTEQQPVARIGAVMSRKQRLFSIDILKPEFLDVGTELYATPIAQTAPQPDEQAAFYAWYVTPEAFKAGDRNGWRSIAWAAWQARAALATSPTA